MNRFINISNKSINIKQLKIENANLDYLNIINNANNFIESKKKYTNKYHLRNFIIKTNKSQNILLLGIFYEYIHIGNIKFEFINNGEAILGILIGNKKYQRKKIFSNVLKTLEPKLRYSLNIHTLYLGVHKQNKPAFKAFTSSGFKITSWKKETRYNQLIMKKKISYAKHSKI